MLNKIKNYLFDDTDLKRSATRILTTIITLGFIVAVIFHLFHSFILNNGYPYNTFLFNPGVRFSDFIDMYYIVEHLNPYFGGDGAFPSIYFPFANLFFWAFTIFHKKIAFILFTAGFFLTIFKMAEKQSIPLKNSLIMFALSYPLLFTIDRANVEMYVFAFSWAGIHFFLQRKRVLGPLLLALAISMKAYPAIFLVLFFAKKQYRDIATTIIFSLLITLFSLLLFDGGFENNLRYIFSGFNVAGNVFHFANTMNLQFEIGLFGILKLLVIFCDGFKNIDFSEWGLAFTISVFLIFSLIALYILCVEKKVWKTTALIVMSLLLFPFISLPYKLLFIFIPLFLFLKSHEKGNYKFYSIVFGLLLIPKDYYFFTSVMNDGGGHPTIASIINPLLMIAVVVKIMQEGIGELIQSDKPLSIMKNNLLELLRFRS